MQYQTNQKFTLTIEKVKECIAFPAGTPLHTTLCGLCDCWFEIEKSNGSTDEEAARVALDALKEKTVEISDRLNLK